MNIKYINNYEGETLGTDHGNQNHKKLPFSSRIAVPEYHSRHLFLS